MSVKPRGLISSHYICPKLEAVQVTNLIFSQEEIAVLQNSHFFTVKHAATHKIMHLFGNLEATLKAELHSFGPPEESGLNTASGKIFRGENYLNLPYIVLDYPRLFSTTSVFAFRSMFWWGNGFSFTLHLQGTAWECRREATFQNIETLRNQDFFICVNDSPWQYHFEKENYIALDAFLEAGRIDEIKKMTFLKLSRKLDTVRTKEVIPISKETLFKLLKIVS